MRLAVIVGGVVRNVVEVPDNPDLRPAWAAGWPEAGSAGPGWTWDGQAFAPPVEPAPAVEAVIAGYQAAIQAHVDAVAGQRNYTSGVHAASYVGSTVPLWAAEAAAFVAWRDAVWLSALALLAQVQGGQQAQPDVAAVIGGLPVIAWPEA